jgi:hypothetical protein
MRCFNNLRRRGASLSAVAPSTALRAVPLPRFAGQDEST